MKISSQILCTKASDGFNWIEHYITFDQEDSSDDVFLALSNILRITSQLPPHLVCNDWVYTGGGDRIDEKEDYIGECVEFVKLIGNNRVSYIVAFPMPVLTKKIRDFAHDTFGLWFYCRDLYCHTS